MIGGADRLEAKPSPQQGKAQAHHIAAAAIEPLHQQAAPPLQGKPASTGERFPGGHVSGNRIPIQRGQQHPGGDGFAAKGQLRWRMHCRGWLEQAVARMELGPATGHALPALDRLLGIAGFTKNLTFKAQHRITAQQSVAGGAIPGLEVRSGNGRHRQGLGLGQTLHQPDRIRINDGLLIKATHPHPMGDGGLLEQAAAGRGSRSQEQHDQEGPGNRPNLPQPFARAGSRTIGTIVPMRPHGLTSAQRTRTTMDRRPIRFQIRGLPRTLLLGLGLGVLAGFTTAGPARAVDFPRPGVVCDAPRQVCFDSQGPSVALTRQFYGYGASNRLLANLSGRPAEREFLLSGGQLCDVNQRICWEDGWRRRQVNPRLSRQLFGTTPSAGALPAPQPPPAGDRSCQLSQRGMPVVNGTCRLYRQNEGYWRYYVVKMGSGQLYRFQRRGNLLVLSDATGSWPVLLNDRSNSVQFRWANLLLEVSRPRQARGEVPAEGPLPPSAAPLSTGETGQDLIESLFP